MVAKAKKPAQKPPESQAQELEQPAPMEFESDSLMEAVEEVLGGGGGSVRIEVLHEGRKWAYVDDMEPGAFSIKKVQQVHGPGEYRFRVVGAGGKYITQQQRVIRGLPAAPEQPAPKASELGELAKVMREGFEAQGRLLVQVMAHREPSGAGQQQFLEMLKAMKDVLGPQQPANDPAKALELLRMGVEFGREASGGDSGGDVMSLIAKTVDIIGEPVAKLLTRAAAAPAAAPAPAVALAAPAAAPVIEAKPAAALSGSIPDYLSFLVGRAGADSHPGLWAAALIDLMGEGECAALLSLPDPVAQLAALEPKIATFRPWFEALRVELAQQLEELRADDSGHGGGDGAGGEAGNDT